MGELRNKLFWVKESLLVKLSWKLRIDLFKSSLKSLLHFIFFCRLLKRHKWREENIEWGEVNPQNKLEKLTYQRCLCCNSYAFKHQADYATYLNYIDFKKEGQQRMVKAMIQHMRKEKENADRSNT